MLCGTFNWLLIGHALPLAGDSGLSLLDIVPTDGSLARCYVVRSSAGVLCDIPVQLRSSLENLAWSSVLHLPSQSLFQCCERAFFGLKLMKSCQLSI